MVNRRQTVYFTLPEEQYPGKQKSAHSTISIGVVVPKGMEKKAGKFISEVMSDYEKAFKRFMKSQVKKDQKKKNDGRIKPPPRATSFNGNPGYNIPDECDDFD